MSNNRRRDEKRAEWEAECAVIEEDRRRKEALGMWLLIEESDASDQVKFILRRIAEHVGMEMF